MVELALPFLEANNFDITVSETQFKGHATELANQLPFTDYAGIIVAGGDGTLHEVINGMLARQDGQTLPLGLIPGGSGNSLAVDLGLTDPTVAAQTLTLSHRRKMDVAKLNLGGSVKYTFNIVGWGLPTDIGIQAEKWRWLGPSRYTLVSLLKVLKGTQPRHAKLTLDETVIAGNFTMIIACNTRHSSDMNIAPKAELDDGMIDVIVVRHGASRLQLLTLLRQIYDGSHIQSPLVEYYTATHMSLDSPGHETLNIDGELTGQTPFALQVQPAAIEMFCKPDSV